MLTIHLEETDCFAAWVSAKEVGMGQPTDVTDPKCMARYLVLHQIKHICTRFYSGILLICLHFVEIPQDFEAETLKRHHLPSNLNLEMS